MNKGSFFALLSRMKYIRRWGLMRSARDENLAEHSLDVAVLTHALAVIGNRRLGRAYNVGRAVLCAMYHDSAEILTGDLPTPVKYASEALRGSYKKLEREAAQRLLSSLPEDLRGDYASCLAPAEPELLLLVKAADKLSALQKCAEEELAGNREFCAARVATQRALEEMRVPEAEIYLAEFFPAYSRTLDSQLDWATEPSAASPKP